ncbi:unnamed protein product [Microthlaspi erraticum]|uniref:Uncharacterized protein n=1 Tax=Microthlaspi erraticum TaxID=1685480 RepID=A0A6D2HRR4_9BRAS|nr:unnamed protein product [Microthlaspi erraticum]
MSYRSTNVENPQDQVYPPRSNQNQQSYQKSYPNSFQEKTFAPNQNRSQGGNQQTAQFSNNLQVHRTTRTMSLRNPSWERRAESRNEYVAQVELRSGRKLQPAVIPLKRAGKEKAEVDRAASSGLDRAGEDASSSQVADLPTPAAAETAPARAYAPKVPYPVPRKKSRKDLEDAKCKEMLKDLTVKLPLSDAVQMIPALKKYMKELISGKVAEDENVMLVSEECSAVLQNKVIKKRSDPGRFVLSVQIGRMTFRMLSLRSRLERESDAVFCGKRLGYTSSNPRKSLWFSQTDRQVSTGAIIDVKGGIIDLHLGDIVMRFEMNKLLKKPMLDGQTYVIEDGSDLVDEVSEEMLLDDPLEVALALMHIAECRLDCAMHRRRSSAA